MAARTVAAATKRNKSGGHAGAVPPAKPHIGICETTLLYGYSITLGDGEQRRRDRKAKGIGNLLIDDEVDLGG